MTNKIHSQRERERQRESEIEWERERGRERESSRGWCFLLKDGEKTYAALHSLSEWAHSCAIDESSTPPIEQRLFEGWR